MYTSVQFHIASKYTTLSSYQVAHKPVSCPDHKIVGTHGKNSVIMNLFSIEIGYLVPEVTVSVVK